MVSTGFSHSVSSFNAESRDSDSTVVFSHRIDKECSVASLYGHRMAQIWFCGYICGFGRMTEKDDRDWERLIWMRLI